MDTEILEVKELIIPSELNEYLENDNDAFQKLDEKISEISDKLSDLSKEREDKEKELEARLEDFKLKLEFERNDANRIFDSREKDLTENKNKIEGIKSEQEARKEKYVDSLKAINTKYNSKISSIETAIEACSDNDMLKKALEEEKTKLKNDLVTESYNRGNELNTILTSIGVSFNAYEAEETEEPEENDSNDFDEEEYNKFINILNEEINKAQVEVTPSYDTEVIEHEKREDVINDIYESEEIMEEHVFPYLNGLIGE